MIRGRNHRCYNVHLKEDVELPGNKKLLVKLQNLTIQNLFSEIFLTGALPEKKIPTFFHTLSGTSQSEKITFFQVFQGKKENLQADLKSASKISLTIREEFSQKKNIGEKKKFSKKSDPEIKVEFLKKTKFSPEKAKSENPRGWLC